MSKEEMVSLSLAPDLVKSIIAEKIKLAVVEAMGGKDQLVDDILDSYLKRKVNSEGKVDNYSSNNKLPVLDYLLGKMIEEAMKAAFQEYFTDYKDKMRDAILRYFQTKKGSAEIAKAMSEGLIQTLINAWRFTVNVEFPPTR